MRSKPSQTKSKENEMYVSRDPALMVLSQHIERQVELFLRDGGQIERLPDYNAVAIFHEAEYNGRKTSAPHASRGGKAGRRAASQARRQLGGEA